MPAPRTRELATVSAAPSAELARLHRHAMLAITHDAVGIAAALELRAESLATGAGPSDTAALGSLAVQLRDVTRMTRLLKGPDADDALMPGRVLPAADWWRLTARLASAIVPRGTRVATDIASTEFSPRAAHVLCVLWLLACEELRDAGVTRPTVLLSIRHRAEDDFREVEAIIPAEQWLPVSGRASRWQRYASGVAAKHHATLAWWTSEESGARWRCAIGADKPADRA
ncbi:hypothetical protein [Gemmatimonas groenlandica]|uniref:Uncharacterized protein n=1 Tax=Gemmatimonas groenlandica TaxID=2732249 RepID=A0A6M4IPI2_9BACT|nr:hypothetical protein [Gemmatimonas groenlandica]QJR35945.1 hypothetical protein HKW67_10720 [Gemmatimonas groenlandica]